MSHVLVSHPLLALLQVHWLTPAPLITYKDNYLLWGRWWFVIPKDISPFILVIIVLTAGRFRFPKQDLLARLLRAMVRKVEMKRAVKKVLKDLPFHEESPRKVRPTDTKTQQLQFLLRGLNFLKAPIVALSLAQQCFGLGWEGWKTKCVWIYLISSRTQYRIGAQILRIKIPCVSIMSICIYIYSYIYSSPSNKGAGNPGPAPVCEPVAHMGQVEYPCRTVCWGHGCDKGRVGGKRKLWFCCTFAPPKRFWNNRYLFLMTSMGGFSRLLWQHVFKGL